MPIKAPPPRPTPEMIPLQECTRGLRFQSCWFWAHGAAGHWHCFSSVAPTGWRAILEPKTDQPRQRLTSLGKDWPKKWVVALVVEEVWTASPRSWEILLVRNVWQERQWLPTSERRLTTPADQTTVRAVPGQTTPLRVC